jgi:acetylornithine deacetylase/succinyl-diaminopimelate desuccinylase-like protein
MLGGRCEGGNNFNAVPAECCFTVDRRINPEEDLETEKGRLFDVFERLKQGGIDLQVEVFQEGRSAGCSTGTAVARALSESIAAVAGRAPSFEMCPGLLEVRFYAEKGVPAFAYGPGRLSVSHGPHECVSLDKVISCAAVYTLTAAKLLAV